MYFTICTHLCQRIEGEQNEHVLLELTTFSITVDMLLAFGPDRRGGVFAKRDACRGPHCLWHHTGVGDRPQNMRGAVCL